MQFTQGGDPLDSSIATPRTDINTPNHVRAGIIAPNILSSSGTAITCSMEQGLVRTVFDLLIFL